MSKENGNLKNVEKEVKKGSFWSTQPVVNVGETVDIEEPINVIKDIKEVRQKEITLPDEFEWCVIRIDNETEFDDLHNLLDQNYVEDSDSAFRFKYTKDLLRWALTPPDYEKTWNVGVRYKSSKELIGFISALPIVLMFNKSKKRLPSVEINFMCIHKSLRKQKLAIILIKEITRKVNLNNIQQALYTGGLILSVPISTCLYTHRPINWKKLYDVEFSFLHNNKTVEEMVEYYRLPDETLIDGLRRMEIKDIDQVFDLFVKYQKRFDLTCEFNKKDLTHWLLNSKSNSKDNVIISYVVENKEGIITDFFSYYILPFAILNNPNHSELRTCYLFYYATDYYKKPQNEYKERLIFLIYNALITSKKYDVDVFNCLTSQDNSFFIYETLFGLGNGLLNYYLFNFKLFPLYGGIDPKTKKFIPDKSSDIGIVFI